MLSRNMWLYFFKIWRCGQLVHRAVSRSGRAYDVVVRLRPDLVPVEPFGIRRTPPPPSSTPRPGSRSFRLTVGQTCVDFEERSVVINAGTDLLQCGTDWFAIGSARAMTVTMDLARLVTKRSAWLSSAKCDVLTPGVTTAAIVSTPSSTTACSIKLGSASIAAPLASRLITRPRIWASASRSGSHPTRLIFDSNTAVRLSCSQSSCVITPHGEDFVPVDHQRKAAGGK